MKALPKRKGNFGFVHLAAEAVFASMKALPKRKGNAAIEQPPYRKYICLNESPSEKEGK